MIPEYETRWIHPRMGEVTIVRDRSAVASYMVNKDGRTLAQFRSLNHAVGWVRDRYPEHRVVGRSARIP